MRCRSTRSSATACSRSSRPTITRALADRSLRRRSSRATRSSTRTRTARTPGARTSDSVIEAGTPAPDFTLPDQDGNEVTLGDLRGQPVVLYFYPKADTPGCTTQACGIRDRHAEYEAAGVTVLGVSPDPVEAIRKFHDKQSLNFTLLADADHAVAERYGVWGEKSMYGKTYMGATRAT